MGQESFSKEKTTCHAKGAIVGWDIAGDAMEQGSTIEKTSNAKNAEAQAEREE